jgi:hypothetical protein
MNQNFLLLWLIPLMVGLAYLVHDVHYDKTDEGKITNGVFWGLFLMLCIPIWNIFMICYVVWHDLLTSKFYAGLIDKFMDWKDSPQTIVPRKEK